MVVVLGYHLMLVPSLLRHSIPNPGVEIAFFMDTPFPSSEFYRILPYRSELLLGVLPADVLVCQVWWFDSIILLAD
jgi:trehalose-6-phosphate synthase